MHGHETVTFAGEHLACDDSPDRLAGALRLTAHTLAYAATGKWLLARLAGLFIFLANLRTRLLLGPTAVVRPSRSGGSDFSARAVLRQRNPMVFGGRAHNAAACNDPPGVYVDADGVVVRRAFAEVRGRSGATHIISDGVSWIATRRTVVALFSLRWPADCAAHEAK